MANTLEYHIKLDAAGFEGPVSKVRTSLKGVGNDAENTSRKLSALGRFNMGNMAMQLQDVAVQLQSGTRFATIFAQQGSQMLSSFGAWGAVAGAVAAVGGAFWQMGTQAREAFDEARRTSQDFNDSLKTLVATGGIADLLKGIDAAASRSRKLSDELKSLDSTFGIGANIADIFGGPGVVERELQASKDLNASSEAYSKILNRALELAKEDASIMNFRARGENDKADALEREIKLARELRGIQALNIPRFAKKELAEAAQSKAGAGEAIGARATNEKKSAQTEALNEARQELKLAQLLAAGDTVKASELKRQIEGRREVLDLARRAGIEEVEAARIIGQMPVTGKKPSDGDNDKAKGRAAAFLENRNQFLGEIQMLKLLSRGQKDKADAIDRELRIKKEALTISKATGASEAEGLRLAQLKIDLEDRVKKSAEEKGGRKRTRGFSYKASGANSGFGSLDDLAKLQEKHETKLGAPNKTGYGRGAFTHTNEAFRSGAYKMPGAAADGADPAAPAAGMRRRMMGSSVPGLSSWEALQRKAPIISAPGTAKAAQARTTAAATAAASQKGAHPLAALIKTLDDKLGKIAVA